MSRIARWSWEGAMVRSHNTERRHSLACISAFKDLSSEALERIERRCSWWGYTPGKLIVDYSDGTDDVFFITEGNALVTLYSADGRAVSFRDLGPGAVFGEYSAIDGNPRSASIAARTSCLVASMSAATFRELLQTEPAVVQALLPQLVMTMRALITRVYEFSTLTVNNRIQAELLRLASLGVQEGRSARIAPLPTHAEIANRISTRREAVARELNGLTRIGIVEQKGRALVVKDLDRLAQLVQAATGE